MRRQPLAAALFLTGTVAALTVSLGRGREEQPEPAGITARPAPQHRVLPGLQADGNTLMACDTWGNAVILGPLDSPEQKEVIALGPVGKDLPVEQTGVKFHEDDPGIGPRWDVSGESFPYACLPDPGGTRLFIS